MYLSGKVFVFYFFIFMSWMNAGAAQFQVSNRLSFMKVNSKIEIELDCYVLEKNLVGTINLDEKKYRSSVEIVQWEDGSMLIRQTNGGFFFSSSIRGFKDFSRGNKFILNQEESEGQFERLEINRSTGMLTYDRIRKDISHKSIEGNCEKVAKDKIKF